MSFDGTVFGVLWSLKHGTRRFEIASHHQSRISPPSQKSHVITHDLAKRKTNITTTGKHNTLSRRRQTSRGKDGGLGTIFHRKILQAKLLRKSWSQHQHAFYLHQLPCASVNSLLDLILFVPSHSSWNHDSLVFPTQRLTTHTFFRAGRRNKCTLSTPQTTRWFYRIIL